MDDQARPYAFVMVEGEVGRHDDQPEIRRWATRIGARCAGPEQVEQYAVGVSVPGTLLARVRITTVVAHRDGRPERRSHAGAWGRAAGLTNR